MYYFSPNHNVLKCYFLSYTPFTMYSSIHFRLSVLYQNFTCMQFLYLPRIGMIHQLYFLLISHSAKHLAKLHHLSTLFSLPYHLKATPINPLFVGSFSGVEARVKTIAHIRYQALVLQ